MAAYRTLAPIALLAVSLTTLSACGGGSSSSSSEGGTDTDPGTGTETTGGGGTTDPGTPTPTAGDPIRTLAPSVRIALGSGERATFAAPNAPGSEVAVLISDRASFDLRASVHDATSGAELRVLSSFPADSLAQELHWSDANTLHAVGLTSAGGTRLYGWDATSGASIQDVLVTESACNFLSPTYVYDPVANIVYNVTGGSSNTICAFDFSDASTTVTTVGSDVGFIEAMALNPDGTELTVTFEQMGTLGSPAGSQVYTTPTLSPVGPAVSSATGIVDAVGSSFQVYQRRLGTNNLTLEPARTELDLTGSDSAYSRNAATLVTDNSDGVVFVALPDATFIGVGPDDANDRARTFNADGTRGFLIVDDAVEVYDLSPRNGPSAVASQVVYPGTFSGTVSIDGVAETVTGSCEILVAGGVGTTGINVIANLSNGAELSVLSQNLLGRRTVRYLNDEDLYSISNAEVSQLANSGVTIPDVMLGNTDNAITASATLLRFQPSLDDGPIEDASDPTGLDALSITLDASCSSIREI